MSTLRELATLTTRSKISPGRVAEFVSFLELSLQRHPDGIGKKLLKKLLTAWDLKCVSLDYLRDLASKAGVDLKEDTSAEKQVIYVGDDDPPEVYYY